MLELTPITKKFILHWGEMGTRWGINRSVAQVHALLYLAPEPLNAEQIGEALSIARSNVSYCLRELQHWDLIQSVPVLGDRREHYQTLTDVWQMYQRVLDERKRREIDPTLELLRQCVAELEAGANGADPQVGERLQALLSFFEDTSAAYDQLRGLSLSTLRTFARSRSMLDRLIGAIS